MSVFRHRANYRRSRRRIHAVVNWQYDTPPPATSESRVLYEVVRRRRRTEHRQPERFEYEQRAAARRRAFVPKLVYTPFGAFAIRDNGGLIPNQFRGHWAEGL